MPNNDPVTKAKDILTSTLESIDAQIQSHEEKLAQLRAEKKKVAASLAPLSKKKQPSLRPAVRKNDVIDAARVVLQSASPLDRDTLKNRVAEALRESHSLSGFSLRFEEAISTEHFESNGSGVSLAKRPLNVNNEEGAR